jgi:ribonuclease-3
LIKKILRFFTSTQKTSDNSLVAYLKSLGISPSDLSVYEKALTHRSLSKRHSNERLEFLGDAILNKLLSEFLFLKFPQLNEGELSKMKSLLVSRRYLNNKAKQLKITRFLQANLHTSEQENNVPGNTLEALLGAVYIDIGEEEARKFVFSKIYDMEITIENVMSLDTDYKSKIYHWAQENKKSLFFKHEKINDNTYRAILTIENNLIFTGEGKSKKEAEQEATKKVWIDLQKK